MVGGIGGLVDGVAGSHLLCHSECCFKLLVGYRLCGCVDGVQSLHFLVGRSHIGECVHKPGITQSLIVDVYLLVVDNHIFGVEHIHYLSVAFAYLMVDKVLITSEFGCMVATNMLVEIRWSGIAEAWLVEHAIVDGCICQNLTVDGTRFKTCLILCRSGKRVGVEITLVHGVEVGKCNHSHCQNGIFCFDFAVDEKI